MSQSCQHTWEEGGEPPAWGDPRFPPPRLHPPSPFSPSSASSHPPHSSSLRIPLAFPVAALLPGLMLTIALPSPSPPGFPARAAQRCILREPQLSACPRLASPGSGTGGSARVLAV